MKELIPLTISKSFKDLPTVLLTQDFDDYLLFAPLNEHTLITNNLLEFMTNHFKIQRASTGIFSIKGKKYFCTEQFSGAFQIDPWHHFLWSNKRDFNRFLQPKLFFKIILFDLFFPLFGGPSKINVVLDKKNYFIVDPIPLNRFDTIKFNPYSFAQLGLNDTRYKKFLSFFKSDLPDELEEFLVLYHDKFMTDIKYQLSLYPDLRNEYWNEVKKCFDTDFIQYTKASIKNYLLLL